MTFYIRFLSSRFTCNPRNSTVFGERKSDDKFGDTKVCVYFILAIIYSRVYRVAAVCAKDPCVWFDFSFSQSSADFLGINKHNLLLDIDQAAGFVTFTRRSTELWDSDQRVLDEAVVPIQNCDGKVNFQVTCGWQSNIEMELLNMKEV